MHWRSHSTGAAHYNRTRVSAQSYSTLTPAKRKWSRPSKCCVSLHRTRMDKRVMIPLRPLMIGYLMQPKPRWTPTLMFQGFAEAESSAKHLWQAGSELHHLFQLTLSVVGVSAQQIWGFLKPRWSNRNFASLPIILQLSCVYVDLIACIQWSCPLFTTIRHLEPVQEGEGHLGAPPCLAERARLHSSIRC